MEHRFYWKLNRNRVQTLLLRSELKLWWVAEVVGVHKTTLRRWLSGDIERIHEVRLRCLAEVLEVTNHDIAQRCTTSGTSLDIAPTA